MPGPSVSRGESGLEIQGLRDFQRELRQLGPEFANALRKINKKVADVVAKAAADAAGARVGSAIKGKGSNSSAKVAVAPNKRAPDALVRTWGTKRRTGWYAAPKYAASSGRQHPEWVGNRWSPGDGGSFGSKPYFIGDAIDQTIDEVEDIYLDEIDKVTRAAFPD
jgi:hypothetical protein